MKLISLNTGPVRNHTWGGQNVTTAIVKEPVEGRRLVRTLGIDGDRQADLRVHGGESKAVYLYPSEHYAYWRGVYPDREVAWGGFGENLTTQGLIEEEIHVGDVYRVGGAELRVTEPRQPCFKLALRFEDAQMVRHFAQSGFCGSYLAVDREGEMGAGDPIEKILSEPARVPVADIFRLALGFPVARDVLERAIDLEALSPAWRAKARKVYESKA